MSTDGAVSSVAIVATSRSYCPSEIGKPAFVIDAAASGSKGSIFVVHLERAVVTFTYTTDENADLTNTPDPTAVTKKGVERLTA